MRKDNFDWFDQFVVEIFIAPIILVVLLLTLPCWLPIYIIFRLVSLRRKQQNHPLRRIFGKN